MSRASESAADRVLVLTPTGRDSEMLCQQIVEDGMFCEVCTDLPALLAGLSSGAGAAVVAHEALTPKGAAALLAALEAQEAWSDIPVLFLAEARSNRRPSVVPAFFERANITILQRPLTIQLFLSGVRSAVRARRRQYQMRNVYRDLERAVQLGDMFVSILGHDLRTPLGAIKMSAETIVRGSQDARALSPAGRILTSADRMARMIGQLLDFARARQQGGMVLQLRRTNLDEISRQIVEELQDANPDTNIRLLRSGDLSGTWDSDCLARVVANLAENAVKHGTPGRPITVELEGTESAAVRLRVTNSGTIPAESLPSLFEPFKRTALARTGGRGLGLGLFIAREIIDAHGGEVAVRTTDGDMTVFEVTLPREARPREIAVGW